MVVMRLPQCRHSRRRTKLPPRYGRVYTTRKCLQPQFRHSRPRSSFFGLLGWLVSIPVICSVGYRNESSVGVSCPVVLTFPSPVQVTQIAFSPSIPELCYRNQTAKYRTAMSAMKSLAHLLANNHQNPSAIPGVRFGHACSNSTRSRSLRRGSPKSASESASRLSANPCFPEEFGPCSSPTRGANLQNHEGRPTQRLTRDAEARTASALSFYPTAAKGFPSRHRPSPPCGGRKQRTRQIPLDGRDDGRDWPQLSDSLVGRGGAVTLSPLSRPYPRV